MNKQLLTLALSIALVAAPVAANAQNSNSGNGNQSVSNTSVSTTSDLSAEFDLDAVGSGNAFNTGSAINSGNVVDSFNQDYEVNTASVTDFDTDINSGVSQSLDDSSIGSQSNDFSTGDRWNVSATTTNSGNFSAQDNDAFTSTYSGNNNWTASFSSVDNSVTTNTFSSTFNTENIYTDNVIGNGNASFDNVGVGINGLASGALLGESGLNINNNQNYLMTGDNLNQNLINAPVGD